MGGNSFVFFWSIVNDCTVGLWKTESSAPRDPASRPPLFDLFFAQGWHTAALRMIAAIANISHGFVTTWLGHLDA